MQYNPNALKRITLERKLESKPEKVNTEPEIIIHKLGSQDLVLFKQLIEIFKDSFDGQSKKEIDEFSLNTMLRHTTFLGFVAIQDNEVIGGLTGYEIRSYYKDESEVFLYNLAVSRKHQGKGTAKLLMKTILKFAKEKGHSKLYANTNINGSNAVKFYRGTGGIEQQVSRFIYKLK
ncbi:GNAT family N-acetyltransferase [Arcticibacterium luteifluviistationis]|uniref:N-acetyltransferase domain-containing protein n=1 Tax=Arcticibacterium luteifluviistationis TaxID=1784714 RepID=A0A2Z4G8R5_9BACT|nr:GNAT family N-acetyltransferase [Arcticibacterium luteifluviistationis]AWV97581.1 hypothetical protein DJ013_05135 [Arcticibacterium luteifluviistationis]